MADGTRLGAEISRELIAAIFQKMSPLHDGAVVITGQTINRARAVLPLTHRPDVPPFFGTRHRAAMGLAERSDALVIAVSEERGTVTLIEDRKIREMRNSEQLAGVLELLETRPDLIRKQLVDLNLPPAREAEIVEEFAQHAEDRYRESGRTQLFSAW